MSVKHLIRHPNPDVELELNVQNYMDAESKLMHRQAVMAKPVNDEIEEEHERLEKHLEEIKGSYYSMRARIEAIGDRNAASLLISILWKIIYQSCVKVVKQLRPVVRYYLQLKLMEGFPDCYYSLHNLRVDYPAINRSCFTFRLNFDRFPEWRDPKSSEIDLSLCAKTLNALEESCKEFEKIVCTAIESIVGAGCKIKK